VLSGKNGYVLPLESDLWAERAISLLTDEEKLKAFGKCAEETVRPFNFEKAAQGIIDAINYLSRSKAGPWGSVDGSGRPPELPTRIVGGVPDLEKGDATKMKQVTQKLKIGEINVLEVPVPVPKSGEILVRNFYSCISTGQSQVRSRQHRKVTWEKPKKNPNK